MLKKSAAAMEDHWESHTGHMVVRTSRQKLVIVLVTSETMSNIVFS